MSSKEEVLNSTNEPERKDRASDMMKEAPGKKGRATKEKLRSIMDAVSALTALGDEDGDEDEEGEGKKGEEKKLGRKEDKVEDAEFDSKKRFIPEHKRPDAALTFPEKVRLQQSAMFTVEFIPGAASFESIMTSIMVLL
jgi:hypothetical protein